MKFRSILMGTCLFVLSGCLVDGMERLVEETNRQVTELNQKFDTLPGLVATETTLDSVRMGAGRNEAFHSMLEFKKSAEGTIAALTYIFINYDSDDYSLQASIGATRPLDIPTIADGIPNVSIVGDYADVGPLIKAGYLSDLIKIHSPVSSEVHDILAHALEVGLRGLILLSPSDVERDKHEDYQKKARAFLQAAPTVFGALEAKRVERNKIEMRQVFSPEKRLEIAELSQDVASDWLLTPDEARRLDEEVKIKLKRDFRSRSLTLAE